MTHLDFFTMLGRFERALDESENEILWREVLEEGMIYHGISAREMADYTEACVASVRRWLKGESVPRVSVRADAIGWMLHRHVTGESRRKGKKEC